MNILACPICKNFPLELVVFDVKRREIGEVREKQPLCELYCGYKGKYIRELDEEPPCSECIGLEIVAGILYCKRCGRWYPIEDEIPRMLPDELRDNSEDIAFLEKYREYIPKEILRNGRPVNLSILK